ncbi:MAG: DHH family phosphoesterase [Chloroflexota bacterium]
MNKFYTYVDEHRLGALCRAVGAGPVLIVTHDNPDPDALASGKALAAFFHLAWNVPSRLVYSGVVARAENLAMLKKLTPEWEPHETLPDLSAFSAVAMVDTQPGAGNNRLPETSVPLLVFDHHNPLREATHSAAYADVRTGIGSTVTLIYQYLQAVHITPEPPLATAMFYGLSADTLGLSRNVSEADKAVYIELIPLIDRDELISVEQARRQREYFRSLYTSLQAARVNQRSIVAWIGDLHRPDMTADVADLLIRLSGMQAALCVGKFQDVLHVALRTEPFGPDAGALIQQAVHSLGRAGGHGTIAGGQIYLEGREAVTLAQEVIRRFWDSIGESGEGEALLREGMDGQ